MTAFEVWHMWMVACLFFFILEVFIPSFIMASIGIGCLLSCVVALLGAGLPIQIIFFSGGTVAGFVGVKPVMKKYMYTKNKIHTNYHALVGRIGKVTETINPQQDTGCVAIDGDLWKAIPENDELIEVGTRVKVTQLNSIIVTVIPVASNQTNPTSPQPEEQLFNEKITDSNSLIIGVGTKKHQIHFDDIIYFYSTAKTTFLVTSDGKELVYDESLEKLSSLAPSHRFFRINRQLIICREIVAMYKTSDNGKIELSLNIDKELPAMASVSRLKAHAFRTWMKADQNTSV